MGREGEGTEFASKLTRGVVGVGWVRLGRHRFLFFGTGVFVRVLICIFLHTDRPDR